MPRLYRLLALIIICTLPAAAQKRQYTMAEAVNGITTTLTPKSVKQGSWEPGTHNFYQVANNAWVRYNADNGQVDTFRRIANLPRPGLKTFPQMVWFGKRQFYFMDDSSLVKTNIDYSNVTELPAKAANILLDSNGGNIIYTRDNNIYIGNRAVTTDADKNIVNGQAVHRNEFGIDGGLFLSPKKHYLAYYRMDQTMVEDYPVIDWSVTPAKNENVKYPMAGRRSHEVTLRVFNLKKYNDDLFRHFSDNGYSPDPEITTIKTEGPKDQYLTCVTWSPDEKYIYIAILNRDQNHLWLNQYNARTGEKVKTILQETDDKYVEPQHPLSFLPGSNTQFIWWSQRVGYMHLWLCDIATNKMRCLTPGEYVVNDLIGFNARTKEVLLTSAKESPLEKHGYAVNWETGKIRRLDTEPGTHNYTASDDGEYLFDVFSNEGGATQMEWESPAEAQIRVGGPDSAIAKRSLVRNITGRVVKVIADSPNPLSDFERPLIRDVELVKQGSAFLYGKLILPVNFDKNKKYPVIVYLYNGPHVQLVKNGFPASGNLWYEYLAQHGYIVWTMDGRGSSNRGLKFEQATFRHLGTVEMEDQLQGVKFLKSLPYVDTTRMGVHGWSFGGFMTTSLMLRHPGVFKCAVAGGPVMDWSMYEVMYGERYMDTPEQNPKGYKESALFDKVANLKGKLLLIHGAQDATVVWQHSIKFLKSCVDNGVQVDYFIYPGYEHNVRGKDRVHLMQKITDYFDEYLK